MKLIVSDNICRMNQNDDSWFFIPDSAIANAGKPFFIPDFADSFVAVLAPVIKVARIGKSIDEKFARRYYCNAAPAVHFRADSLRNKLLSEGKPADISYSFDRSVIAGDFLPVEDFLDAGRIHMLKNGIEVATINSDDFLSDAEKLLSRSSCANTLKMGDLIMPIIAPEVSIAIGDRLEVSLDGDSILKIAIK